MKSQNGFSLVEIMVTVAIMGILMSIAVPNYMKVVEKGRQSQAKSYLSTVFVAETQFMKEFGNPTYCLWQIGAAPTEVGRYYSFGFLNADPTIVANSIFYSSDQSAAGRCNLGPAFGWFDSSRNDATFNCSSGVCGGTPGSVWQVNNNTDWSAGAWGQISTGSGLTDVWQIDQTKTIKQIQSGL